MASSVAARLFDDATPYPSRGSIPSAANQLFPRGTIATRDTSGNAISPSSADASGRPALGLVSATVDNRTGSELGGGAGDVDIEILYGVFAFDISGTTPLVGEKLYVVDNQTLSTDSNGGLRGYAGICTEVRTLHGVAQVFCHFVPMNAAIGATVAGNAYRHVPLTSFLDADGDPLAKFVSEANPTFGFNLADSEGLNLRWNNHATPGAALCQVGLPDDLDDTETVTLEFLCSKSGATLADATTLTVTAFLISVGDLHDADANAGGVSNAMAGAAAAKTTAVLSVELSAANVPAGARSLTFTVKPTDGTLGTDDLMIHDVRVRYVRK